jgi:Asp-tRNA(Asn)/Glu-tRNA(Gln) amidotransferase A subunit family amidase
MTDGQRQPAVAFLSIEELVAGFASRELSPVEVTQEVLARIGEFDEQLHSYLTVSSEQALAQAREAEIRYRRGADAGAALPPLLGVPISIKDLFDVEGVPTSLGSRLYGSAPAGRDSIAVARLRCAGAVLVGKTNTAEFGQAATTENRLGPGCGNPWDPTRTAGGSSGGAAASVAAGLATAGLGSDAGGSIRIPAALCGLFGIKPTFGSIPDDGPFRAMTDFSCPGPIVRRVADARPMLQALLGRDVLAMNPRARFRIGWCAAPDDRPVDPGAGAAVERAVELLGGLGHNVEPISVSFDGWMEAFGPLVLADEWRFRRHLLDEHAGELTSYARRGLEAGARITPVEVDAARVRMSEIRRRISALFDDYDLIATPTTACAAFPIGERPREVDGRPVDPLWGPFPFTAPINVAGLPAASVPVGLADGLPVGLQVIARDHAEGVVLDVCEQLEEVAGFPAGEMARRWRVGSP